MDILRVCEIFLDESSANKTNISDFQSFHVSRNRKKQGGLAILVKNYIPARLKEEFLYLNTEMIFESCIVECFLPNNDKLLIAVIYRPPSSNKADFIDKFENMCDIKSSNAIFNPWGLQY